MSDKQNPPWHMRSSFLGRWVLRVILLALAYVMTMAYWHMITDFWNGVPFRTTTRLMSEHDWDTRFGLSDIIIYALILLLMLPFWFLAVGSALLSLEKISAHNMITALKRGLTGKRTPPPD